MTATLQLNQSQPFAGLGTASYTVPTGGAGLYTLSFKSFLPYQPAGTVVSSSPLNTITNVTLVADSAGSLNSTWFKFYSAGNVAGFYVWYNINSAGVDPAPSGLTGIQVTGATNASAATLATATITAINASAAASQYVVAKAGTSGHAIISNINYGSGNATADGTAATGFTFTVTQAGSDGTPAASGLNGVIKQNSTVVATFAFPSPTQAILGGSAEIQASAADVLSLVLASTSTADSSLNAVKTIINLFQGPGA